MNFEMARRGKRQYSGFSLPVFRRFFIGRQRVKYVPPVINPPTEELSEQASTREPVNPCQHVQKIISNSVVELIIDGPTRGEVKMPISIPGVILLVNRNLLGILFGGEMITKDNSYQIRLPEMIDAEDVSFEDFVIAVKSNGSGGRTQLALLTYRTEVAQHCCRSQIGLNCSRNQPVFIFDYRFRDLVRMTDKYDPSLNDGHVNVAGHSTFVFDCSAVSHSSMGSLVFDSSGNLIGIAFSEIGPVIAIQASFIRSVLLEINPKAKSIDDIFLNVRRR